MTPSKSPQPDPNIIVLPVYFNPSHYFNGHRKIFTISILALAASAYVLWPSEPDLKILRLRLKHVRFHTVPRIAVDISISLALKVSNGDVYDMKYKELEVAIGYRGKRLGHVWSSDGHVRPWGSSYVDAELELDGVEVLFDVVHLLEDLARGTVPFDTVTTVEGQLGLFFFELPLKAKVSCEVVINTVNQTIAHRNCYSE